MATPKWFDAQIYMQNKLAQMQATDPDYSWDELYDAFRDAGFVGEEGQYEHFVKFGAAEEVAPNAYFDADEYYAAKAKQYYAEAGVTGSEEQIANVKNLIKTAGMNAWTHYQQFGSAEGVNPSNAFDASDYCAAKAKAMNAAGQKDPDGNDWTAESIAKAIDDAGMSVLEHYMTYAGTGEGEVASGATYPVADDDQVVVPNPGETVVVDGSATTYTGTAGDDTFYLKTDVVLQEYDTLDGGEGNDTLILEDQALGSGTIKNIENLVVRDDGKDDAKTYDLSAFSSSFTLESGKAKVDNVTSQKLAADGTATRLDVTMADDQTSVELISTSTADVTFSVSGDKLESMNLTTTGNTTLGDGDTDTVKNVAITALGDAAITLTNLDVLENVTVTGAGAVELKTVTGESVKSVNATGNTGGVTVDLSSADNAAFTGGAGADTLTVNASKAAHDLGAGDDTVVVNGTDLTALDKGFSVDGGDGVDTLQMTYEIVKTMTSDAFKVFTNFEELTITSEVSGTLNMAGYTGIGHLTLQNGISSNQQIQNMQSGSTLELTTNETDSFTVSVADAVDGEADVLNIALTGDGVSAGGITVADVETINVAVDGTGDHSLSLTAAAATSVTVSGDSKLSLTLTNSNKVDTIDAVGNSGGVEIVNALNDGATFTGGTGADVVTLGKSNTVFGGEGEDTFKVSSTAVNELSEIKDFGVGDKIQMMGSSLDNLGAVTLGKALVSADPNANLDTYVSLATAQTGAKSVAWFQYAGDTYVVVNDTTAGFDASKDYIVKLSGTDIDLSTATVADGVLTLPEGA